MSQTVSPSQGLGVVHLFCKVSQATNAEAIVTAVKKAQQNDGQVMTFAVLGHKSDIGFMALNSELWKLRELQTELQNAGLNVVDSYVSLTEVSEYAKAIPAEKLRPRLYPVLPPEGKNSMCFYPMSKRRNVGQNWYALSYEDRENLMRGHGKVGSTFKGRVVQMVTGSTGLDDYEWGVTLFAVHPDDLKDAVYTMRFDEASAQYAEFGPFYTGLLAPVEDVLSELNL